MITWVSPRAIAVGSALASSAGLVTLALCPPSIDAQARVQDAPVVWIPEGAIVLGADGPDLEYATQLCQDEHELTLADECGPERFAHETPAERVYLRRYGLDRTEVSRARYQRCVAAGVCAPSLIPDEHPELGGRELPVVGVRAQDAMRYCAFVGGRLPTEEEWEKGARGADDRRRFPWGNVYDGGLANHGRPVLRTDASDGYASLAPVGRMQGISPYGLRDMAGNVWEWTSSRVRPRDLAASSRPGDVDDRRVVRGGSYLHPAVGMRVTSRSWLDASSARTDLGIRCAYDPP